ncbi:MAG: hypothetical protein WAW79_04025 [Steroidobacteraceae bacterium]
MNPASKRVARVDFASGAICLCLALTPTVALAQAWLPEKGSTNLALDYTSVLNKKHYNFAGQKIDVGHTDSRILTIYGSYSPSDRVLVSASLPFVQSRYRGAGGGGHDTEIDNGSWHDTFTDLLLTVHMQVANGPAAFAPYVGAVIPTNDYVVAGHAAPGRGLQEYWLGFYAALSINEWVPRTYIQFRGNHALVEKVAGISHDRTNATLEIGHFLNESWSARVIVSEQWTHGGIDVPVPVSAPLFPYHDRLAAEEFVHVGAGASWTMNDRVSVYGIYSHAVDGSNGHKVDHRFSIGVNYGLSNRLSAKRDAVIGD